MAIYIHCPSCHVQLESMGQECSHCGASLPPGVVYALSVSLGLAPLPASSTAVGQLVSPASTVSAPARLQDRSPTPTHDSPLRPWLAALLSVVCGLGQCYNGQIRKGVVLLLCGVAAVMTWHFGPVKVFAPLLWLYALADAYLVARRGIMPASPKRSESDR